jgi:hypothetical protein
MLHALTASLVGTVAATEQMASDVRLQVHLVELGILGAGLTMHRAFLGTESNCPAVPSRPGTPHRISPNRSRSINTTD